MWDFFPPLHLCRPKLRRSRFPPSMSLLPLSTTESRICACLNRYFHPWIGDSMVSVRDSLLRKLPVSVSALSPWKPFYIFSQRSERVRRPSLPSLHCYRCCLPGTMSTEFRPVYLFSGDHGGSTSKGIAWFFRCHSFLILSLIANNYPSRVKVALACTA